MYNQTKDKFIELIIKRFYDRSSYCRAKALKAIRKLIEANVVPKEKY